MISIGIFGKLHMEEPQLVQEIKIYVCSSAWGREYDYVQIPYL